jgi:hypothetical protein
MGLKWGLGRGGWARQAAVTGGLLCLGLAASGAQTLTVSGSPAAMVINTAIAGQPPTSKTDGTTTYSVKAGNKNSPIKITGRLNAVMPAGMSLTVTLAATTGATSNGTVTLDATARDLVGDITHTNVRTASITYVISAAPAAGVVAPQSRTVTFTVAAWP